MFVFVWLLVSVRTASVPVLLFMHTYSYTTRVDYSLTDVMGFMHHSNYPRLYENARWEFFRSVGLPYSEIEQRGYWIPVVGVDLKYHKPAFYDDELTITVSIKDVPRAKFPVYYQMYNGGEKINEGVITLGFMRKGAQQACRAPEFICDVLAPLFASV